MKGDLGGNPGIQSAVITSGQFRLRAEVPDDLFSLAVEDDDEAAGIAHAAFVDRWLPEDAPPGTRERMLAQLAVARRALAEGGVSYLGLATAELGGRGVLLLLGIAVTAFDPPDRVAPGSLLAAMLRARYPAGTALVEEFETPHGPAVGMRRTDVLDVPAPGPGAGPLRLDTGVSQGMVVFPDADALGVVTGFCFNPADIDLATILVAAVACRMKITRIASPAE